MRRLRLHYPPTREVDYTVAPYSFYPRPPNCERFITTEPSENPPSAYLNYDDFALRGFGKKATKRRRKITGGAAPVTRTRPLVIPNKFWSTGYKRKVFPYSAPMDTTNSTTSVEKFERQQRAKRAAERMNAEMPVAKTIEEQLHLGNYQTIPKRGDESDPLFSSIANSAGVENAGNISSAYRIQAQNAAAMQKKREDLMKKYFDNNYLLTDRGRKALRQWVSESSDADGVPAEEQQQIIAWLTRSGVFNGVGSNTVITPDGRTYTTTSPWLSGLYRSLDENGYKAKPIEAVPLVSDGAARLQFQKDAEAKREAREKKRDETIAAYKEEYRKKWGAYPSKQALDRAIPKLVEPLNLNAPYEDYDADVLEATKLKMNPPGANAGVKSSVATAAEQAGRVNVAATKVQLSPGVNSAQANAAVKSEGAIVKFERPDAPAPIESHQIPPTAPADVQGPHQHRSSKIKATPVKKRELKQTQADISSSALGMPPAGPDTKINTEPMSTNATTSLTPANPPQIKVEPATPAHPADPNSAATSITLAPLTTSKSTYYLRSADKKKH